MSSFLSEKYFKYRGLQAGTSLTIEDDVPCESCGYNLRGLREGTICPECGTPMSGGEASSIDESSGGSRPRRRRRRVPDPMLCGSYADRTRWRIGFAIGAACLLAAMLARFSFFVCSVLSIPVLDATRYLAVGFLVSAAWTVAAWMLTPPSLDAAYPRWWWLRWAVRGTQLLWVPGYVLLTLRVNATAGTGAETALLIAEMSVRATAGIGAIALAVMLMQFAEDAELDDVPRRLNNVIWLLPIFTILLAPMPSSFEWIFAVVFFLLLLGWSWFMLVYAHCLYDLHRHVAWGIRHGLSLAGRDARIARKKQEMLTAVESRIRPPERPADDAEGEARVAGRGAGEGAGVPLVEHASGAVIRQSTPHVARRPHERNDDEDFEFMG